MTEQIPAKAIEAAAQVRYERFRMTHQDLSPWSEADDEVREMWCEPERVALAAALPHLAPPARVAPSVEEVTDALGVSEADWRRARERGNETPLLVWQARSIAARLATQPTVAQVREQAAREMGITPVFEDTPPNDKENDHGK